MSDRSITPLDLIYGFFGSWRFPVFAVTLIVGYELLLLTLLFMPGGTGQVASFADEFRIWCFGYDPATGSMEWAAIVTTFTSPLVLVLVALTVWIEPLRTIFRSRPRATVPYAATAALIVGSSAIYLTSLEAPSRNGELPFPAETLRIDRAPPAFSLTNQAGESITLEKLRGRVVLMTAVYSRCGLTCPMIWGQAKRVVAALSDEQRRDLSVVAITLDPEHDTEEVLAQLAFGQSIAPPTFNLCTGIPADVETLLDRLGVARNRDPETGVIDHANLFFLIDRKGRLAYKLTLGERQERWLTSALRLLLDETAAKPE